MSKTPSIEKEAKHALIVGAKSAMVCRICTSPLTAKYDGGDAAHRSIRLVCPKHGTLKDGDRYMTGYRTVFGGD